MSLGVILKGFNCLYSGKRVELLFEFIPQILLLLALFGFMDLLIIVKWLTDYTGNESSAPSIISTMIVMALGFGSDP